MTATLSLDEARQRLVFEERWYPYCHGVAVNAAKAYSDKIDAEDLAQHLATELFAKKDRLLADKTPDGRPITDGYTKRAITNMAVNYIEKSLNTYFWYSDKYVYTNKTTRRLLEQWMSNPLPEIADEEGSDGKSLWALFVDCSSAFERLSPEDQGVLYDHYLNGKSSDGSTDRRRFQDAIDRLTKRLNKNSRSDQREYISSRKSISNREALDFGKENW
jgi:hypothetical protein